MILAAEALEMTHNAEYEENKVLLKEIEEKIKKAAKYRKYHITWIDPCLPGSAICYLESLGYIVVKMPKDPSKCTDDNYYYVIRWSSIYA